VKSSAKGMRLAELKGEAGSKKKWSGGAKSLALALALKKEKPVKLEKVALLNAKERGEGGVQRGRDFY